MDNSIQIFEVAPRDGLQNEKTVIPLESKLKFARGLLKAGVTNLELGSFVRPDLVPQMADTDKICARIRSGALNLGNAEAWFLVPNRKGLKRAIEAGVTRIALFTAASDSFTRNNIGMTVLESLDEFKAVIREGKSELGKRLEIRGYVSTAFGCPFEGKVSPSRALRVIQRLIDLGVDQLSIGDTIGVTTPRGVVDVVKPAVRLFGSKMIAVHFHDTRGTALANSLRSIDLGVRIVDSSAGGLGGCPFAPGAAGNLATEDLVYMLNGMGIKTGIELDLLCKASLEIFKKIKRPLVSRYLQTYASQAG